MYDVFRTDERSRAARQRELEYAHFDVGARKLAVEGVCATIPGEFALTIKFGRGVGKSNTLGAEFVPSGEDEALVDDEQAAEAAEFSRVVQTDVVHPLLKSPVKGAAYGNKRIGNVIIPCGVCLIIGPGGSGKTPLAHALAGFGVEEYAAVRIGEPLGGYGSSERETAVSIASAMVVHRDVVIDSIKDLLALGGNLMKSGLSRTVITTISDWSALANDLGCTLYIPLNPSSDDADVYSLLVEAAKSNATSTIYKEGELWKAAGRTGEGLPRFEDVTIDFRPDRSLRVDGIDVGSGSAVRAKPAGEFATTVNTRAQDAVRRILNPQSE